MGSYVQKIGLNADLGSQQSSVAVLFMYGLPRKIATLLCNEEILYMKNNNQSQNQSKTKKEWHKKWWGILLIIFVFMPLFFMVFSVTLILNSPRQTNKDVAPIQTEQQQAQEFEESVRAQELITNTYAPIYCQNHQDTTINEPTLNEQNWPGADNSAGLTDEECQIIIRKLFAERDGYATNIIEDNIKTVSERKVAIGMIKIEVVYAWGSPRDINRTTLANGTSEQWVYGNIYDSRYVYFDNDIVTSIQS